MRFDHEVGLTVESKAHRGTVCPNPSANWSGTWAGRFQRSEIWPARTEKAAVMRITGLADHGSAQDAGSRHENDGLTQSTERGNGGRISIRG